MSKEIEEDRTSVSNNSSRQGGSFCKREELRIPNPNQQIYMEAY